MAPRLTFTLDCENGEALAAFWSEALGYQLVGNFGQFWPLASREGDEPWFVLQQVDELKAGKNRMHVDLHATDLDAEVGRLEALGATRATGDAVSMGDMSWYVMLDPEGNEFCIVYRPD